MKKNILNATKRTVFGKKLKAFRREGHLPGNVYGKGVESLAVQVSMKEFRDLYKEIGATGLVELNIEGDTKRPVLIHDVHMDHIKQLPLHADFYQVNLKEKVITMVPVVITGEPKAVADKLGQLLQTMSEVEVEALPADLPGEFTVDVTELAELDAQITVADLKKPQGVEVLTEPTSVIAKIAAMQEEEPEPVAEEAAEGESSSAEATADKEGEETNTTDDKKEE